MENEIINKVEKSGLTEFYPEDFYPKGVRVEFDLKQCLYMDLILKEKDFREFVSKHDWSAYQDKFVALHCSVDVIVPTWAFMLVAVNLEPHAKKIVFGDLIALEDALFRDTLQTLDPEQYRDKKVMVRGCSQKPVPPSAFVEISRLLRPVVKSLMFGEACSTVPLFKNKS